MNHGLVGKLCVVGGGSRGLVRAVAQALVEEGSRVILVARDSGALDEGRRAGRRGRPLRRRPRRCGGRRRSGRPGERGGGRPRRDPGERWRPAPGQRARALRRAVGRSVSPTCRRPRPPPASARSKAQRGSLHPIPLGRYGDPAELGRVAAFLLSPGASYVSGVSVQVDGGWVTAVP